MDEEPSFEIRPKDERLSVLRRTPSDKRRHDDRYSRFIRSMRIALPMAALAIVAVLLSWDLMKSPDLAPPISNDEMPSNISKNELLNPRFDSLDEKNQPYTITAKRAVRASDDELMLLDEPMADIVLNSGNWLAIQAKQGAYRQLSNRLLLKEDVTLFHDAGYTVLTQELDVDLAAKTAKTDLKVSGNGPAGTLDGTGMSADINAGILVVNGPAKLVLYDAKGMEVLTP